MDKTGTTLETAIEGLLRRIIKEEIEVLKPDPNGNDSLTLLDLNQAAQRFNLPKSRITQAVRQGDLACVKVGHYLRFSPSDLREFIERHREK